MRREAPLDILHLAAHCCNVPVTFALDLMKSSLLQKRGILVAVIASVVAFFGSYAALMLVYWCLRPFVWAALYGVPYSPPDGPYLASSGEWLFVKGAVFLSSAVSGYVAAKWGGKKSWVWAVLAALLLLLTVSSGGPSVEVSYVRKAIFFLAHPLGIVLGALIFLQSAKPISAARA